MKIMEMPEEFIQALPILRKIKAHGFDAYFVGGSVRDAILRQSIHDVDIATSALPSEIKQIFPYTVDVGIEHGTVLVVTKAQQYEVTTFRLEAEYQDFRRPEHVSFVRSLAEDLKRRDFTMNAIALDESGEMIDLFDGMQDLEQRVIRAVGNPKERFHEDALRMMRALRFASQLDFQIEDETLQAIAQFHTLLEKISVERITAEFVKLLLGKNRAAGLQPFLATECYQYCPDLRTRGEALYRLVDLPAKQLKTEVQAWTLLVHTLGLENAAIRPFLKEWKCANQLIQQVQQLIQGLHKRLHAEWDNQTLFQLGLENVVYVEELLFYDRQAVKIEESIALYEALPIKQRRELRVSGNDLLTHFQRKPGKWVGQLIEALEARVLAHQVVNTREALLACATQLIEEDEQ